jgi:hypothetical protein
VSSRPTGWPSRPSRANCCTKRFDPRLLLQGCTAGVLWDALQVAYFIGC